MKQLLEALDLALEALEMVVVDVKTTPTAYEAHRQAITAIKQARALDKKAENARELGLDYETYAEKLEQPVSRQAGMISITVPAPVAYLCENAVGHKYFRWKKPSSEFKPIALYTIPPVAQRTWVGLTDEEREQHRNDWRSNIHDKEFRAIEAKLRSKNT
jgi:hypothetical protein